MRRCCSLSLSLSLSVCALDGDWRDKGPESKAVDKSECTLQHREEELSNENENENEKELLQQEEVIEAEGRRSLLLIGNIVYTRLLLQADTHSHTHFIHPLTFSFFFLSLSLSLSLFVSVCVSLTLSLTLSD